MRKKKLLSLVLAVALALTTVIAPGSSVFAAEDSGQMQAQAQTAKSGSFKNSKGFKWTLDSEGTLKITGKGDLWIGLDDVKSIRTEVKKIVIGKGAATVYFHLDDFSSSYEERQEGFPNLVSISLPSTLKSFGGSMTNCGKLKTITGGKNVEQASAVTFRNTEWLESSDIVILGKVLIAYNGTQPALTIPEGIAMIGERAVAYNNAVQNVTIPASVKEIGDAAFFQSSVAKISGGSGITKIGAAALDSTPWLKNLTKTTKLGKVFIKYKGDASSYTVPASITQIYDGAFSGCMSLNTVTIKAKLSEIPDYAFENCKNLKKITLPSSVTDIAYGAFDHCSALTSVTLPSSLKTIGTGAFIFCDSLSKVTVNKGANNVNLERIEIAAFGGCKKLKSLTIPKKVNYIGNYAYGYDFDDSKLNWVGEHVKLTGVTISGVKGTAAQKYANANGITFKAVKDNGTDNTTSDGGYSVGKSGTVVKAAEKKKNGLSAPGIDVHIAYFDKNRIQEVKLNAVTGATGYQIYYSSTGKSGSWKKLASFKNTANYYGIEQSTTCYYKGRAYKKVNGKIVYGPYSKTMKIK